MTPTSPAIPFKAISPGLADLVDFCDEHRETVLQCIAPLARTIVEASSFETFLSLADRFGGTELYLPDALHGESPMAGVVNAEDFAGLKAALGAGRFAMPTLHAVRKLYRDHWISDLSSQGLSRRTIAAAFGVHVRTVGRVRQNV